jgi:hypothetical protein
MAFKQEMVDTMLSYQVGMDGEEYARELFKAGGPSDLIDTMAGLLAKREQVGVVCLMVRELVLLGWQVPEVEKFNELYEASQIVRELEGLVINGDYWDRRQAVHALGKTYVKSSVPVLSRALEHWLERDPLFLPRIFFERSLLDVELGIHFFEEIVNSKNYLTRWAALQILTEGGIELEATKPYFERLKNDLHPLVAAAAKYEGRVVNQPTPGASPEAIQGMLFANAEPPDPDLLAFVNIENWFTTFLRRKSQLDYNPKELEVFVADIVPQLLAGRRQAAGVP